MDTRSKRKEKDEQNKKQKNSFKEVLAEKEKATVKREITCDTTGYTKNAKAMHYEVKMHEYN